MPAWPTVALAALALATPGRAEDTPPPEAPSPVARPADGAAPRRPWPDALPPARFTFGDGRHDLRVGLAGQLRAQQVVPTDGGEVPSPTVALQRLRFTVHGRFIDETVQIKLQLNLVPGKAELIDLFTDVRAHPRVRLRAGLWKIPFTRYRDQSFVGLHMADWALVTRAFGGERQLGLAVHDGWRDGFQYAFAVFTGGNQRVSHGMGLVDGYGTDVGNPSRLDAPDPDVTLHPELVLRAGWGSAGLDPTAPFDREGGPLRGGAWLSATADTNPVRGEDFVFRLAPEGLVKGAHVSVAAAAYAGWLRDGGRAIRPALLGGWTAVGWHAHRHLDLALRWAQVWRLPALAADVEDLTGQPGPAGTTWELGPAAHVRILGDDLAWQTDVRYVEDALDGAVVVRSQLQAAF